MEATDFAVNSSQKSLARKTHSKKAQTAWTDHRIRLDEHPSWDDKNIISMELATTART
jgi:hypothetical protein